MTYGSAISSIAFGHSMRFTASLLFVSSAAALSIGAHRASAPVLRAVIPQCTIAVFGGTGGTGSEAVFEALDRGESVVTLARDPSKMTVPEGSGGSSAGKPLTNEKLTVFQGSVTNKADVDKVFAYHGVRCAGSSSSRALGCDSVVPSMSHTLFHNCEPRAHASAIPAPR